MTKFCFIDNVKDENDYAYNEDRGTDLCNLMCFISDGVRTYYNEQRKCF